MKIIFMGTPQIAVPTLKALIESEHEVALVVTQPDQKSGRGMHVFYSPVKETALAYTIPCLQPEHINEPEVLDALSRIGADIVVIAAYAQKIPDELLSMAPYGCINMHPSLLPKYRGSGPLRGPILNGDAVSGVTIMQVVSAWDAGDILMQQSFALDPKETAASLEEKSAHLGAELMLKTLAGLKAGTITPVPQDPAKATYLKQITKEAGLIDFSQSAVSIERQIRACIPWPSAYTFLNGKTFKIWEADALEDLPASVLPAAKEAAAGTVAYADRSQILIRTSCGYLKPLSVQAEGKKRMPIADFLRGNRIEAGVCFGQN